MHQKENSTAVVPTSGSGGRGTDIELILRGGPRGLASRKKGFFDAGLCLAAQIDKINSTAGDEVTSAYLLHAVVEGKPQPDPVDMNVPVGSMGATIFFLKKREIPEAGACCVEPPENKPQEPPTLDLVGEITGTPTYAMIRFAPLGGNRPDCAVVACAAMSVLCHETGWAEIQGLPGDVLDGALAIICAPVIIKNARDVEALHLYAETDPPSSSSTTTTTQRATGGGGGGAGVEIACRLRTAEGIVALSTHLLKTNYMKPTRSSFRAYLSAIRFDLPADTTGLTFGFRFLVHASGLRSLDLRSAGSVQSLPRGALTCLSSLSSVILPDALTKVGAVVLNSCKALEEIDLSNTSLTETGEWFLGENPNLRIVKFPRTLKKVAASFLPECDSLEAVDLSHTELTSCGDSFLAGCPSLTSVRFPACLTVVAGMDCCGSLEAVDLSHTALTLAGDDLLSNCCSLTSVAFPESLTEFKDSVLHKCEKLEALDLSRTALRLP